MKITIRKYEDNIEQRWFRTQLDSEATFSETFKDLPKNLFSFFKRTENGGSYSLSFDSSNLESILNLFPKNWIVEYVKLEPFHNKKPINKKCYLKQVVTISNSDEYVFNDLINKR